MSTPEETAAADRDDLDWETRDMLTRARTAQRESPGSVFSSRDLVRHTRVASRAIALKKLRELRERGLIEVREAGVGYIYWGVTCSGRGDRGRREGSLEVVTVGGISEVATLTG